MSVPDNTVPVIPRGVRLHHDKVRNRWVLLAPERTINLDPIGHAILVEIDGARTFAAIVRTLAERYSAPSEQIAADAGEYIQGLANRRILELSS